MRSTPVNLAMLGDPNAAQDCEIFGSFAAWSPLADGACGGGGAAASVSLLIPGGGTVVTDVVLLIPGGGTVQV